MSQTTTLRILLGVLVALQFGYPITFYGELWTAGYMLAYAGMITFGIRVVRLDDSSTAPFVPLATVLAGFSVWFSLDQSSATAQRLMLASVGAFQLALLASLMTFIVSRAKRKSGNHVILAAISAYLLLGGVFAIAFNLLEAFSPGSFTDAGAPDRPLIWQGLLYDSYVTLSTLGYGEILPISPWARSLVTLESVTGTLFIAIVIARLVGAPLTHAPAHPDD